MTDRTTLLEPLVSVAPGENIPDFRAATTGIAPGEDHITVTLTRSWSMPAPLLTIVAQSTTASQILAELRLQWPGVTVWLGVACGTWQAMIKDGRGQDRLVEGETAADLHMALVDVQTASRRIATDQKIPDGSWTPTGWPVAPRHRPQGRWIEPSAAATPDPSPVRLSLWRRLLGSLVTP